MLRRRGSPFGFSHGGSLQELRERVLLCVLRACLLRFGSLRSALRSSSSGPNAGVGAQSRREQRPLMSTGEDLSRRGALSLRSPAGTQQVPARRSRPDLAAAAHVTVSS